MTRIGIIRRRELLRTTNRTSLSDDLPALVGLLACCSLLLVRCGEEKPPSRLSAADRSFSLSIVFLGVDLRERSVVIVVMSLIFRGQVPPHTQANGRKELVAVMVTVTLAILFLNPFECPFLQRKIVFSPVGSSPNLQSPISNFLGESGKKSEVSSSDLKKKNH